MNMLSVSGKLTKLVSFCRVHGKFARFAIDECGRTSKNCEFVKENCGKWNRVTEKESERDVSSFNIAKRLERMNGWTRRKRVKRGWVGVVFQTYFVFSLGGGRALTDARESACAGVQVHTVLVTGGSIVEFPAVSEPFVNGWFGTTITRVQAVFSSSAYRRYRVSFSVPSVAYIFRQIVLWDVEIGSRKKAHMLSAFSQASESRKDCASCAIKTEECIISRISLEWFR